MRRRYRTWGSLVAVVLLAGRPLRADDWALGGFFGGTATRQNTLTLQQPQAATNLSMHPVRYDSRSLKNPIYYGYRFTWFARPNVGLEGEFIHPKVFARTGETVRLRGTIVGQPVDASLPMSSVIERFSLSHGLNFLLVNAVFSHQVDAGSTPRFWLIARGGAGITIPHVESDVGGRERQAYELGSAAFQGAIGGELRFARHVAATMEYKFTTTNESVGIGDGTLRGRFNSHHVALGITWRR